MFSRQYRLLFITLLTEFSALLVIFVVSRTLADHYISLFWMGLIGAGFGLSCSLSSAYCGALSDRIGRRSSVVLGLLMALVAVGLAWMGSSGILLIAIGYVVMGISLGSIYPALSAWLTEGRANGAGIEGLLRTLMGFSIAWNLGLIAAQIAGGWLYEHVSPTAPLGLAAISLLIAAVWMWRPMPSAMTSTLVEPQDENKVADRWRASTAYSRLSWIANIGGTFAMAMILHLFPALMVDLNVGADLHGILIAYSRCIVVGTYLLMYVTRFWHYRFSTSLTAQVLGVAGLITLSLAQGLPALLAGLTGLALLVGHNYFASLYYSSTRGGDEARGAAMGLHEATLAMGMTGGSMLGGVCGTYGGFRSPYVLGAVVIAILGCIQGLMWLQYLRNHERSDLSEPFECCART